MRYILGMAKSNLDLKGAKGPKLEFDLLRLIYAVKELRFKGNDVTGYLLVMNRKIADRAESWKRKYEAGDNTVVVEVANLSSSEDDALRAEKTDNIAGMIAGSLGNKVGAQSNAERGKEFGERELRRIIRAREGDVIEITDKHAFPFGIQWDFYGQSRAS